jgi:ATP-dependent Clp endopeptidase proteolytic subunit ClpP
VSVWARGGAGRKASSALVDAAGLVAQARALRARAGGDLHSKVDASRAPWEIRNAVEDEDTTELVLSGVVGDWWFGIDADLVVEEIRGITTGNIRVIINSPGGDVFGGVAIYNALAEHKARVETRVSGMAASAASFIAQAGDVRVMSAGSMMMIHDPWGLAIGGSSDMRAMADLLDKIAVTIGNLYAARSGLTAEAVAEAMDAETWYTADEAVDTGLADEAIPAKTGEDSGGGAKNQDPGSNGGRAEARLDTQSLIDALRGATA